MERKIESIFRLKAIWLTAPFMCLYNLYNLVLGPFFPMSILPCSSDTEGALDCVLIKSIKERL